MKSHAVSCMFFCNRSFGGSVCLSKQCFFKVIFVNGEVGTVRIPDKGKYMEIYGIISDYRSTYFTNVGAFPMKLDWDENKYRVNASGFKNICWSGLSRPKIVFLGRNAFQTFCRMNSVFLIFGSQSIVLGFEYVIQMQTLCWFFSENHSPKSFGALIKFH